MIILWQAVARKSINFRIIPYQGFENSGGAAYSSYVILKVFYEKLEAVVITPAAVNSFGEFQ